MLPQTIAGYTLEQALSSNDPQIERWRAIGVTGSAEIFIIPHAHSGRYKMLPKWGPFSDFSIHELSTKSAIVVPGMIAADLRSIRRRLGDGPTVGFAWHIAGALADLHDKGESHGLLHADNVGLDDNGQLCIRPALAAAITEEPDSQASAQATDCWQLGFLLDALGISEKLDSHFSLLMAGLRREKAIIRMQSGRAVRQALSAVTARNVQWEDELKKQLGDEWGLDRLPATEERILPRLYPRRPTATRASLPERAEEYKSLGSPSAQKEPRPTASRRKASRRAQDSSLGVSLPNVPLNKLKAPSKGIRLPSPNVSDENLEEDFEDAATEAKVATVAQIRVSSPSRKAMISANPDQPFVQLIPETRSFPRETAESVGEDYSAESNQLSEASVTTVANVAVKVAPAQQPEEETLAAERESRSEELEEPIQPRQEVEERVDEIDEAAEIPEPEPAALALPNHAFDQEPATENQEVERASPTEESMAAEQEDEDSFFDLDVLENALAEVEEGESAAEQQLPERPETVEKQPATEADSEGEDDDKKQILPQNKPETVSSTEQPNVEKFEEVDDLNEISAGHVAQQSDAVQEEEHQDSSTQETNLSAADHESESRHEDVQIIETIEEKAVEHEVSRPISNELEGLSLDEEGGYSEESEEVTEETPEVTMVIATVDVDSTTQPLSAVTADGSQENTETTIQLSSQDKPPEQDEIIFDGLDDEQWEALEEQSANSIGVHAEEQYPDPVQEDEGAQYHLPHETEAVELEKPKWEGVTGVTADPSREAELGAGKWTESSERPVAHFVEAMSQEPTREFENPTEQQSNVPLQRDIPVTTSEESLKWEGVTGVTADPSREAELGAGKWTEASERSAAHFVEAMSDVPTREFEHPLEKQSTQGGQLTAVSEASTSADQPKWGGVTGVTADPSREAELGAGKWTEASERSAAHFAEAMSDAPTRELEDLSNDDRGWRWRLIVILCGVMVAAVAFYAFLELLGT